MENKRASSNNYLNYLYRLELARKLPGATKLDPLEERMLSCLAPAWHLGKKITVLEAMKNCSHMSSTTAHRRLKSLRKKGFVNLVSDEDDNRIKYVLPTDSVHQYFAQIWQCIEEARADRTHSHRL
ncbi:MAG: hypothetical protein Q7U05_04220 [Polaromonas sp.]|nr:hypothetical protein [Polaromonas sp.]